MIRIVLVRGAAKAIGFAAGAVLGVGLAIFLILTLVPFGLLTGWEPGPLVYGVYLIGGAFLGGAAGVGFVVWRRRSRQGKARALGVRS